MLEIFLYHVGIGQQNANMLNLMSILRGVLYDYMTPGEYLRGTILGPSSIYANEPIHDLKDWRAFCVLIDL